MVRGSRLSHDTASPCIMSAVLLDGVTFTAPLVHVAFIGIRGEATVVQTPRPCVIELGNSSDLSIKDIFARAAFERFNLSTDDAVESLGLAAGGGTTLFRSTALTLAPQIKLTDLETRVVVTSLDETAAVPMKPLFLIAHIKVEKLARELARPLVDTGRPRGVGGVVSVRLLRQEMPVVVL